MALLALFGLFLAGSANTGRGVLERLSVTAASTRAIPCESESTSMVEPAESDEIESCMALVDALPFHATHALSAPESGSDAWYDAVWLGPPRVDLEPNREPPGLFARLG